MDQPAKFGVDSWWGSTMAYWRRSFAFIAGRVYSEVGWQVAREYSNRSAGWIGTKFGLFLRMTGSQWAAKFHRNRTSRFETADDARKPTPANPQLEAAGQPS